MIHSMRVCVREFCDGKRLVFRRWRRWWFKRARSVCQRKTLWSTAPKFLSSWWVSSWIVPRHASPCVQHADVIWARLIRGPICPECCFVREEQPGRLQNPQTSWEEQILRLRVRHSGTLPDRFTSSKVNNPKHDHLASRLDLCITSSRPLIRKPFFWARRDRKQEGYCSVAP